MSCGKYIDLFEMARRAFEGQPVIRKRVICMFFAAVAFVLGTVPIITSGLILWEYILSAGNVILIYGVGKIVHAMYENGKQNVHSERHT